MNAFRRSTLPIVKAGLLLFACTAVTAGGTSAPTNSTTGELPRRGSVGIGLQASEDGVVINMVRPDSPAEKAGVQRNDRIVSLNGTAVKTVDEAMALLKKLPDGAQLNVIVRRGDEEKTLTIILDSIGAEEVPGSKVTYSSVTVPDGYRLRTIITEPPEASGKSPAFMFVQGIYCATIDRPTMPEVVDTRLVHEMAKAGFVTMRVDKPGLGDSEGPMCGDIDFETELVGYVAALKQLKSLPGVDSDRVYIFGHSMGGVMAPYMMKQVGIRGAIVYGTLARTWLEYTLENHRRQLTLSGASEGDVSESVLRETRIEAMMLVDKMTLGEIWAKYPELKEDSPMFEPTRMYSRHMSFFHQLQDLNLARAWEEVDGYVLAIHGEYDWVTARKDHDLIAAIVNKSHPGRATSMTLPKCDHGFTAHDSLQASLVAMGQGRWDGSLPKVVLDWIRSVDKGMTQEPDAAPKAEAGT